MQRQKRSGLEQFSDSQIHIYEAYKYRESLPWKLIEEITCTSLWADFRKNPRSFISLLSTYRKYISNTYPDFSKVFLTSSNFKFILKILLVRIRSYLKFRRGSLA